MAGWHQVVFSNNWSPRAAMWGSGLWTYNSVVFGAWASQRLSGDNNSAIYLDSNNSDISTLVFRDAEDDVYGRIQGWQWDYFGIVDGDSNWAIQHLKDTHTMFAMYRSIHYKWIWYYIYTLNSICCYSYCCMTSHDEGLCRCCCVNGWW